MCRTTISLPYELEARLELEATRRRAAAAKIAVEANEAYLARPTGGRRVLRFAALAGSRRRDTARSIEDVLVSDSYRILPEY